MKNTLLSGFLALLYLVCMPVLAQEHGHHNRHPDEAALSIAGHNHHSRPNHNHHNHDRADSYVPAAIMGDHTHEQGQWMFSYRYMRMHMADNRSGTNSLSPTQISGVVANRFFGAPMQPATLRIVPTEMTTDMHMFGGMYGVTDRLTLMGMVNYLDRDMDHITFAAAAPGTAIGTFNTSASGLGDTKLSALYNLYEQGNQSVVFKAGVSLPTGATDRRGTILNPMGAQQNIRLPYAMQLGTGTYDFEPALTYASRKGDISWGAQYMAKFHPGRNGEGYSWGDKHQISGWSAYRVNDAASTSLRVTAETEESIDGIDTQIIGPVQTANPDFYGGERISLSLGLNLLGQSGALKGHHLSFEVTLPVHQDLNGTQLERDNMITMTYRKRF